mgnify:CR=1 FL=1
MDGLTVMPLHEFASPRGAEHVALVRWLRGHGKTIIAHLEGVADRNAAAALIGCDIAVERADMPAPEEGSYYWSDLNGMRVEHRDGPDLGRVDGLLETVANEVMVVQGNRERLIPFFAGQVDLEEDLGRGVICVDWEWA